MVQHWEVRWLWVQRHIVSGNVVHDRVLRALNLEDAVTHDWSKMDGTKHFASMNLKRHGARDLAPHKPRTESVDRRCAGSFVDCAAPLGAERSPQAQDTHGDTHVATSAQTSCMMTGIQDAAGASERCINNENVLVLSQDMDNEPTHIDKDANSAQMSDAGLPEPRASHDHGSPDKSRTSPCLSETLWSDDPLQLPSKSTGVRLQRHALQHNETPATAAISAAVTRPRQLLALTGVEQFWRGVMGDWHA